MSMNNLWPFKKSQTNWFEITKTQTTDNLLDLQQEYSILLQNQKKYPYLYETIAILRDPKIKNNQINFELQPKTFNLIKRNHLFSLRYWSLQYSTLDEQIVKRSYSPLWINKLEFQETATGKNVDFFVALNSANVPKKLSSGRINLYGPYQPYTGIMPPWVMAPDFPPEDMFWRQSGETWFFSCWLPYWKSLSEEQKKNYLELWKIPEEWQNDCAYINASLKKMLKKSDSDIARFVMNYRE